MTRWKKFNTPLIKENQNNLSVPFKILSDSFIKERTFVAHEVVGNVCRVIHTEAHGDDKVYTGDHVYCQAPEVDEPSYIYLE